MDSFEDFFDDYTQKYLDSRTGTNILFGSGNLFEEPMSSLEKEDLMKYKDDEDESDDFREFVVKCRQEQNPEETITLFKKSIRDYILSDSIQHYTKRISCKRGVIVASYLSERNVPHTVEPIEGFDDVIICILHETLYEM